MNFLEADVPDPTDFPPQTSAPGLRALDGSFRCDICGELYDAPVTITCGHCFCSAVRHVSMSGQPCTYSFCFSVSGRHYRLSKNAHPVAKYRTKLTYGPTLR